MQPLTKFLFFVLLAVSLRPSVGQNYSNPILPGFHPDPSICRVGAYYYLVNSTFEYFPGVPVYRSKDLVNWELIGHVVNRNSQLNMDGYNASAGIHAPTIRYKNGTFYVVFTNINDGIENLLFTADSAMTKWSDPIVITKGRPWGIDPDLFFDDDGKCYFLTNRKHQVQEPYPKFREIVMQELDLSTMKLVGEPWVVGSGNVKGATSTEGPHMYKKDGLYYLLVAEGGTGTNHAVTIASSENIKGPFQPCPYNPILTHRFMQKSVELRNLGHADLVQTPEGDWWMVFLGVRYTTDQKPYTGRETYLVRVDWDGKYPIVNPGYSQIQYSYPLPLGVDDYISGEPFVDDFEGEDLDLSWTFLRSENDFASLTTTGELKIDFQPETISSLGAPSFIGRRVENESFEVTIDLRVPKLNNKEEAGLVLLADDEDHVKVVFDKTRLTVIERKNNQEIELVAKEYQGNKHQLTVKSVKQRLSIFWVNEEGEKVELAKDLPARSLSNYRYTGVFVGPYASSNGQKTRNAFYVGRFEYRNE